MPECKIPKNGKAPEKAVDDTVDNLRIDDKPSVAYVTHHGVEERAK